MALILPPKIEFRKGGLLEKGSFSVPEKEVGKRSSITFFISITFWSLSLALLSLFCQTPFAGLLLRHGESFQKSSSSRDSRVSPDCGKQRRIRLFSRDSWEIRDSRDSSAVSGSVELPLSLHFLMDASCLLTIEVFLLTLRLLYLRWGKCE